MLARVWYVEMMPLETRSMTLTISLPSATVEKLQAHAAACGTDVDTLVREAVEAKLAVGGASLRDIMAPVHEDYRKSGLSEDDLDRLIQEALADARAAKRSNQPA
jgi:hypothetical protein